MQIIGLSGASGSGKTTVAGMLAAELLNRGFTVKLDAFAVPIKRRIMSRKAQQGMPSVIDKVADREAMQYMGTAIRAADPDYCIRHLHCRNDLEISTDWLAPWKPAAFLIIDDVRFPNEAEFIKNYGVLIHVCGCKKPLRGEAAEHESESHIEDLFFGADYAIAEQLNLKHLAAAVKALVDAGEHLKQAHA